MLPTLAPGLVLALLVPSAALTIFSGPQWLAMAWLPWVFKPLSTVLILLYAASRQGDVPRRRALILAGLVFSLAGDVALLWPQGFVAGLLAFLVAHLLYIAAFCLTVRPLARWLPFGVYAVIAAAVLSQLWPGVPAPLRVPVVAYVVCLAGMAAQAAVWWLVARGTALQPRAAWAAWGGLLFMTSDALLATNKFMAPLPEASLWVLSTYWTAQWCIASALMPRRRAAH